MNIGNITLRLVPAPEVEYEEAICMVETASALVDRIDIRKACRFTHGPDTETITALADALDLAYFVLGQSRQLSQAEMVARARVIARVA